jgi:hypothetical protein
MEGQMMVVELEEHGKGHCCDMKPYMSMIIIVMSYVMLEQARGMPWL